MTAKLLRRFLIASITFLCGWANESSAQYVNVMTAENAVDSSLGSVQLFSYDANTVYVFRFNGIMHTHAYYLQCYSRDSLRLLSSIPIPIISRGSARLRLKNLFIREDYFQILYSWYDEEKHQEKLELVNFSKAGELIRVRPIDYSEGKNEATAGSFQVFKSEHDDGFIASSAKLQKGNLTIDINSFDVEGNKIKNVHYDNVTLRQVAFSSIDALGQNIFITRDAFDSFSLDWRMKILVPDSTEPIRLLFKEPAAKKLYLSGDFQTFKDKNGYLNFITPYSLENYGRTYVGFYVVQLDMNGYRIVRELSIPFIQDPQQNKGDFRLTDARIIDLQQMKDGRLVVTLENQIAAMPPAFSGKEGWMYISGFVLTLELDENFSIQSRCWIDKYQKVYNEDEKYIGVNILQKSEKRYYIYNERPENLTPDALSKMNFSKAMPVKETSIAVVATDQNKITGKSVAVPKSNPNEVDALLVNESMYTGTGELFSLRQIGTKQFLVRIRTADE